MEEIIERICTLIDKGFPLLQWLWDEKLIDEYTFDMLIKQDGGWGKDDLETQNG